MNIVNVLQSIKDKEIPGKFNNDLTMFTFPIIKYKNKHGEDIEWVINIKLIKNEIHVPIDPSYINLPVYQLGNNYVAEITVLSGMVNGKVRKTEPYYITMGKNINKKNETNVITQAFKEAFSMYKDKFRKTSTKNLVIKPLPMAIQNINTSKNSTISEEDFNDGLILQRKLNGVRYVTFLQNNDKVIQYSRTGMDYIPSKNVYNELLKILTNLPEMEIGKYGIASEEELNIYQNSIPYLDGELYMHGKSLQYISGQARKQSDDKNLNYHIFDVFFPYAKKKNYDMISKHRQEYLDDLFSLNNNNLENIIRVENFVIYSEKELNSIIKTFIKDGYEGGIVRKNNKSYEYSLNNYHSHNVVKIKPTFTDEFKVVGFTQGSKGKAVGKIIWICEVNNIIKPDDKLFNVVPNMSDENRSKLFNCLSDKNNVLFNKYIKDQLLTVEYSELSPDTNKPLQGKAIAFRTYENQNDPIKKIYNQCNIY